MNAQMKSDVSVQTHAPTLLHMDTEAAKSAMAQALLWSHLACFLAGAALMSALAFGFIAVQAWERADVLQLEVESFKNVLHEAKLPTAAHLPGESP